MDRFQLEKMRDEKYAELKLIEDLLSKLPSNKQPIRHVFNKSRDTFRDTSRDTFRDTSHYKSYKPSKIYTPPPSGKTWFDWMRSVIQSNGSDMLLATLGGLASKNGFVLEEGDKLSNFVGRVYGIKLYMSDEEHPRMFVTVSDTRSDTRPDTRSDTRSDTRPDTRPDTRSDTRPDTRSDTRPDTQLQDATNNCINQILGNFSTVTLNGSDLDSTQ